MLVPLFLVPLLIVAVIVGIFYVVGRVVSHEKTIGDLIQELQSGGVNERWQAAANLSQIAIKDPAQMNDPAVRARLRSVFEATGREDTRLRKYLAELWGAIGDAEAVPIMVDGVGRMKELLAQPGGRDGEMAEKVTGELIYYLGSLGRLGIGTSEAAITGCAADSDAGVRNAVAAALGDFGRKQLANGGKPSPALVKTLVGLHEDGDAWVRMNAALALAKIDRTEGLPTLRSMLDRDWLKSRELHFPNDGQFTVVDHDPAAVVIVSALIAIDHLVDVGVVAHGAAADGAVRGAIEAASKDQNPGVQERARSLLTKLSA
jgi:HEAT repeat protein